MLLPVRNRLAFLCCLLSLIVTLAAHAQGSGTQTIQFLPIADRPVSSAPFQVVAVASSNLPVDLTVAGPATLDNRRLMTLTGVGQITVTATQLGNSQFAPVTSQLSFNSTASPSSVAWTPASGITYGTPVDATVLNASATAVPLVDTTADVATISDQLNTSKINASANFSYPASSSLLRYEGATMQPSPHSNDGGGYQPVITKPGLYFRVVFTCDCQQFEFALQSRGAHYRLWVDGNYQGLDALQTPGAYPNVDFVLVQFPDKRSRQIKISIEDSAPFYGLNTADGDTISAPQVPVGERVIIFGDSWTGPTILQPFTGPPQDGTIGGSGYGEFLGEYFNWDYWVSGEGSEGFTAGAPDDNNLTFPQRLLTDVCNFSPAAVLIMGGVNDGTSTESAVQTATDTSLSELQTCLPNVPVYFYGPQGPSPLVEQAFAAVAPNYSAVHYVDMGGQNWIYGDLTTTYGNAYLYFSGHPTPLGHNFLAEKISIDLTTAFPALMPTPYALTGPAPVTGSFSYQTASGAAVTAGSLLPAGSNVLTADFAPTDAANIGTASGQATVLVNKAGTTTLVLLGTQNGVPTVTVQVEPQISGTPTGSVTVASAGMTLATLPLTTGQATYPVTGVPSGTYTLNLAYSGDSNFNGSTNQATVTVTQPVLGDFTLAAQASSVTTTAGNSASVVLQVTPQGGLNATLSLSCTGLPAGASCAFASGSTLAVNGTATQQATVVIKTAAATARSAPAPSSPDGGSEAPVALCGVLGFGLLGWRSRRGRMAAMLLALAGLGLGLAGCGATSSSPSQPQQPSTYTVQVVLTDTSTPSISHAVPVTLTVQP